MDFQLNPPAEIRQVSHLEDIARHGVMVDMGAYSLILESLKKAGESAAASYIGCGDESYRILSKGGRIFALFAEHGHQLMAVFRDIEGSGPLVILYKSGSKDWNDKSNIKGIWRDFGYFSNELFKNADKCRRSTEKELEMKRFEREMHARKVHLI